jgi:ABC-type Mn2+/Zn2+ transport system ATPase subunit
VTSAVKTAVAISDVHVDYGQIHAIGDLSLEIPSGASVSIIGPNGSGKSTLLKVIAGVIEPTSGSCENFGASTSIVLQSTDVDAHVPLTVRDVVAMARYPQLGLLRRPGAADRDAVGEAMRRS